MNTEYALGNLHFRFESRARRRWLVVLFYALMAALDITITNNRIHHPPSYLAAWTVGGLATLVVALLLVLSGLTGPHLRDDEREKHRRENAFARAYRILGIFIVVAFWAVVGLFPQPNPITPLLPSMVRAFLAQLPVFMLFAIIFLYASLPGAILLWTEPDMEEAR